LIRLKGVTMLPVIDLLIPVDRLTPENGHYFFGYYDNPAWNASETCHLCQQVEFWDRLPKNNDIAKLGYIRLSDREFIPFAETNAWNFQQGTMLQWHPQAPDDEVIFNRFVDDKFVGVIHNVNTGVERLLSRPVTNVNQAGTYAVSVNFSRMFDFRPGYGYVNMPDPFADIAAPEDDGVFLIDLATGDSSLIISIADIAELYPGVMNGRKLCINHLTFNTSGERIIMLVRNFPDATYGGWNTALITADMTGQLYPLTDYQHASHYHWRDAEHLLIYNHSSGAMELNLLTDQTQIAEAIDPSYFKLDGHCSYSPDRRWLLYDSYPIDNYRYLYLYNLEERYGITLGAFWSSPLITDDIRCDLHPRWSRSGNAISFDSIHEGFRGMYWMDVSTIVGK
jgi:hypothetical protein